LPEQHRVEPKVELFEASYKKAKRPSLIWSWLTVFKADFIKVFALTLCLSGLNIAAPILVNMIMRYLAEQNPDTLYGFQLLGLLAVTQLLAYVLTQHIFFLQVLIGAKSSNTLVAIIYRKLSKVTPSTNKNLDPG
jgi:ABC-type bacteriocin/lantibiotic exporter with double-glycine peptidase domain